MASAWRTGMSGSLALRHAQVAEQAPEQHWPDEQHPRDVPHSVKKRAVLMGGRVRLVGLASRLRFFRNSDAVTE